MFFARNIEYTITTTIKRLIGVYFGRSTPGPIGTKVKIPALYGEEVFIVEDRMNRRYDVHMDIWMEETADARNFGLQLESHRPFGFSS